MKKIILDGELQGKFDVIEPITEVCDRSGTTAGFFVTPEQFQKLMYAWLNEHYTDEEAETAWNSYLRQGGLSSREAWDRVKLKLGAREGAA
jgi:hypothetical protein